MRRPPAAAILALSCVLVAGCASTIGNAEVTTPSRTIVPRPLVERELPVLLLSPDEASAAMGAPMAITGQNTTMSDNSATMAPPECLALDGAAEAAVYAGSDFRAEKDQSFNDGDNFKHYLKQAVVLFAYAEKAAAFYDAAVAQWPACHEFTHTQSDTHWTVGPIANADNTLSTTVTLQDAAAPGWGCGRALTLANNIIVDVNTCSADPADSAVRIANQIGTKVAAQW
jgi:hypothetical protein